MKTYCGYLYSANYYPYGMLQPKRNFMPDVSRYTFNGQEQDREWDRIIYGDRPYDRKRGQFDRPDPVAKKYPDLSPYISLANNPIYYVDEKGREIKPLTDVDIGRLERVFQSFGGNIFEAELEFRRGPIGRTGDQNIFRTNLTTEQFQFKLAESGLSETQSKQARAIFDVLSSEDVVEIGVVTDDTKRTELDPGQTIQAKAMRKQFRAFTDPSPLGLVREAGNLTHDIRSELLLQTPGSEQIAGGGAFAFFLERQRTEGKLFGVLLLSPSTPNVPFFGKSTILETKQEAFDRSLTESIVRFSEKKEEFEQE